MLYLEDVDIKGRTVLVREDFNVPLHDGRITDENRIVSALPTLKYILEQGAALVVCSHLGKPKKGPEPGLSLAPVAKRLGELLGREVPLAPDCVGPEVESMVGDLQAGDVLLLENLRFHAAETGKTPDARGDFGRRLGGLADVFVNDAFAVCHRENASVVDAPGAAKTCSCGMLLKKEWEYLGEALREPARPFVAVTGGAKVSSKLGVLTGLLGKVDHIIVGGAMANTFAVAQGFEVGRSMVEDDLVDAAADIIDQARAKGTTLHLPLDVVWGKSTSDAQAGGSGAWGDMPQDAMALDIGPETVKLFVSVIEQARTVVWNGPMGLFENPAFADGSEKVCRAVAGLDSDALTIVGGGDSVAMVGAFDLADEFGFISTGGGSFLEFLEGKELPGFRALKECASQ